jgi:hypothetical protein
MLNNEDKKILTDTFGMDVEELKTALASDDEVKIKYKSGDFLDEQALTDLKDTVKRAGYNEGKTPHLEMEAKRVKEKFGIDVEGKNFDNIFESFKTKTLADAKIAPDKKVSELNESLTNLQKKYTTDLGVKDQEILKKDGEIAGFKTDSSIAKHLPDGLKGVNQQQFTTLAKSAFGFGTEDGSFVIKKNGKIMKDNMEKNIAPKDALTDFATLNGWIDKSGRGGGDNNGGSSEHKTIKDVFKHLKEKNIDPYGDEGQKIIDEFNN